MAQRILIAEDNPQIAQLEQDYLEIEGFETQLVTDGETAAEEALSGRYDLLLLDVMLPGKSGYDVCREVRRSTELPILMVTARTESADKILGLGLGADDYISKPFDPAELVARVKSHLKRYQRAHPGRRTGRKPGRGDPHRRAAHPPPELEGLPGRREIRFPNREFELLRYLARNPNIVFSREQLFEAIWGYDYIGDSSTVTVHINRIREKIEEDPSRPRIIETVWGAGYRLNR